jgi:hypothetical protein
MRQMESGNGPRWTTLSTAMDQGVLGFGGPAVGLGVPRNRSISASDEFRELDQLLKFHTVA